MALIVAPAEPAESFVSIADAATYHAARGNAAWAALASDTVREQLLRKAADYMEQVYRDHWAGYRVGTAQALSWPRYQVPMRDTGGYYTGINYYASTTVPIGVANACAELALRAATVTLAPDLAPPVTSETVGPIAVTYAVGARQQVRYQAIDNMLKPYLNGSAGSVMVVRA